MSPPPKMTAKQKLLALHRLAEDEKELDRIDTMSEAEVERYLLDHDVDLGVVDAHATATREVALQAIADAEGKPNLRNGVASAVPQHEGERRALPRAAMSVWLIAAVFLALILVGGAVIAGLFSPKVPDRPDRPDQPYTPLPSPEPVPETRPAAATLREQARAACAAKDWATCVRRLQAAKESDPTGDRAADVQKLWDEATKGANSKAP